MRVPEEPINDFGARQCTPAVRDPIDVLAETHSPLLVATAPIACALVSTALFLVAWTTFPAVPVVALPLL